MRKCCFVFLIIILFLSSIIFAQNSEDIADSKLESRSYGPDEFPLDEMHILNEDFMKTEVRIITRSYLDKESEMEIFTIPVLSINAELRKDGLFYTSVKLIRGKNGGCCEGVVILAHSELDKTAWLQFLNKKKKQIKERLHQPRRILPKY